MCTANLRVNKAYLFLFFGKIYIMSLFRTGVTVTQCSARKENEQEGKKNLQQLTGYLSTKVENSTEKHVCLVELRFYGQVNPIMSSAFSLPNHTFTGQA